MITTKSEIISKMLNLLHENKVLLENSNLEKTEKDNLVSILKNSLEEFAVYSNMLGLWKPDEDDESQWMRNIKIRISLFQSQFISKDSYISDINKKLVGIS